MPKYSVGDKVRVIKHINNAHVGKEGKVRRVALDGLTRRTVYNVLLDEGLQLLPSVPEDSLEDA